jgi:ribosomal protein S18 acetylase RimI-like enzyme
MIQFRQADNADLPALARIHRRAYSRDHFLAVLPETVLADYYSRFLDGGSQILLAVAAGPAGSGPGTILGFAAFGRNIEPRIKAFKRDCRTNILRAALGHPFMAARKLAVTVGGRLRSGSAHTPAPALLLSIAVAEAGKGVGRALLEEMVRRSAADGEDRIGLYVRHGNVGAINGYLRVGFRIIESMADQYYMERDLSVVSTVKGT